MTSKEKITLMMTGFALALVLVLGLASANIVNVMATREDEQATTFRAVTTTADPPTSGSCVIGIGGACNNNEKSNMGTGGDTHHSNPKHQHNTTNTDTSLSNQANATLHKTFEKCYKIIAPSYLRDSLTIPATALLEKYAVGNATGIANTDNNMVERVSACMKGEPYTPFEDLNK
jgi:hypothetical protein